MGFSSDRDVDMEKGMGLIAGKLYYTQSHDSNHIVPFGYPCHRNDRDMCLYLGLFSDLSGAAWPGCDFLQPACQIYRAFLLVRHGSDPGTASEKLPAHFIGRHLHAFFQYLFGTELCFAVSGATVSLADHQRKSDCVCCTDSAHFDLTFSDAVVDAGISVFCFGKSYLFSGDEKKYLFCPQTVLDDRRRDLCMENDKISQIYRPHRCDNFVLCAVDVSHRCGKDQSGTCGTLYDEADPSADMEYNIGCVVYHRSVGILCRLLFERWQCCASYEARRISLDTMDPVDGCKKS